MKLSLLIKSRFTLVLAAMAVVAGTEFLVAQDVPELADPAATEAPAEATATVDTGGGATSLQERTTIDYRDAPLLDVIRHLSDASKINVAISPGASTSGAQNVTIRLTDVTYETALKTVLDLFHLGTVLENGVLRIDTIENIKREQDDKKRVRDERMKQEPTRIMIWQLNHAKAQDLAGVLTNAMRSLQAIDPRLSVQADTRSNKLIIEGTQEAQTRVKTLLQNLDRSKQSVVIEARIVEASNEVSRTLRVNWGARFGMDSSRGLSTGILFPNSVLGTMGGAGTVAPLGVGRLTPEPGAIGMTLGAINGMINIDGILRAYETENLAHVIASPSMTVMDNEKAHFEETIEIRQLAIPGGTAGTTAGAGASFSAKLALDVTPLIADDNTLELDVSVDRDTPTTAPTDPVQGKIARNAKTKLTIRNGETAVIGGLYQTSKRKGQGRIPLLGKLPIIGFLFRTSDDYTQRTELMILITPRILSTQGGGAPTPTVSDMSGFPTNPAAAPTGQPVTNSLSPQNTSLANPAQSNPTQPPAGNNLDLGEGGDFGADSLGGNNTGQPPANGANSMGLNNSGGNSLNTAPSGNPAATTAPNNTTALNGTNAPVNAAPNNGMNAALNNGNAGLNNGANTGGGGNAGGENLGNTNSLNGGNGSTEASPENSPPLNNNLGNDLGNDL